MNPRAYATVEVQGRKLAGDVEVRFFDGISGRTLDTVHFESGTDKSVRSTIQLVATNLQVQVTGTFGATSEVRLQRVLLPRAQEAVANEITTGLTPLSLYLGSADTVSEGLGKVGRSIALLQLAGPDRTYQCTGFLVRNDLVATAAHCVSGLTGVVVNGGPSSAPCVSIGILFNFIASVPGGAPVRAIHCLDVAAYGQSPPAKISLEDGSVGGIRDLEADLQDIALMRIDPALVRLDGVSERQALILQAKGASALASVISYPQGGVERVARDCAASAAGDLALLHKCSTAPGSSGAPVLQWTKEGWKVVGLHVCCSGSMPEDNSFAQLQSSLMLWNLAIAAPTISAHVSH